jgi:hypothetical protein
MKYRPVAKITGGVGADGKVKYVMQNGDEFDSDWFKQFRWAEKPAPRRSRMVAAYRIFSVVITVLFIAGLYYRGVL